VDYVYAICFASFIACKHLYLLLAIYTVTDTDTETDVQIQRYKRHVCAFVERVKFSHNPQSP